jgi:hypothetical protein
VSLCPKCNALPSEPRHLIELLLNPTGPDGPGGALGINTVRGAGAAVGLLLQAIAEFHGMEQACRMLIAQGNRVLSPPGRLRQLLEREQWLDAYDDMPDKQSARACAKALAERYGIAPESALRRLRALIARREKRDGGIHEVRRAKLEALRAELKERAKPKARSSK